MKILVTGGAGFIGSNLALKLLNNGYEILLFDNLSSQVHGVDPRNSYSYKQIENKFKFILGDVRNYKDWKSAIEGIDVVIHLAAETGTGQSMYEISNYVDVNVGGTSKMLEAISNSIQKPKKIIIASSRSIYGEGKYYCENHGIVYPESRKDVNLKLKDFDTKCPICEKNLKLMATDENSKLHPSSIYGFTKKAQEELVMIFGKTFNIPVVGFRFQNVYGPGQSLKNPYTGILSIFSTRIRNGNDLSIFEDGLESRDFVYIDDAVDAIILGIENNNANFKVFNVGSGEQINVLTVAKTLVDKFKANININITGQYR
jgi:dTDP-L-rhamnose 4-epimerase